MQEVTAATLTDALVITRHYMSEALRLRQAAILPANIAEAQRLLDWLHQKWSEPVVSTTEIVRLGPNSLRCADVARRLIDILVRHGWLTVCPAGTAVRSVPRRDVWAIVRADTHPPAKAANRAKLPPYFRTFAAIRCRTHDDFRNFRRFRSPRRRLRRQRHGWGLGTMSEFATLSGSSVRGG